MIEERASFDDALERAARRERDAAPTHGRAQPLLTPRASSS